jgi:hypothetical protein
LHYPIGAHELGLIDEDSKGISNNLLTFITQVIVGKREKLHVFDRGYLTPNGTGNETSFLEIILSLKKLTIKSFLLKSSLAVLVM